VDLARDLTISGFFFDFFWVSGGFVILLAGLNRMGYLAYGPGGQNLSCCGGVAACND
jgi:hypothetical protein